MIEGHLVNKTVLITGATGFIGSAIVDCFAKKGGVRLVAAVRDKDAKIPEGVEKMLVLSIDGATDWSGKIDDIDIIVHAAGRAHIINDTSPNPCEEYKKVNVDGTVTLLKEAIRSKVERFIFISSISVNGESTEDYSSFHCDDIPNPISEAAKSKYHAEKEIQALLEQDDAEYVIVRPPLAYGPNVKANFKKLVQLATSKVPLPLGNVDNRRSYVSVRNLVEVLYLCCFKESAANQVFLVSDGIDVSTPRLLKSIARVYGVPSLVFPFPVKVLSLVLRFLGQEVQFKKMSSSLVLDIEKTKELLEWEPDTDLEKHLKEII